LFGVIRICNQGQRHYYRAEERELAQALAHQITLALQLARVSVQEQRAAILSERTRLAREMHDTLSQGFTGIVIQMEGAEDLLDNDPQNIEELRLHLQRARTLARGSLAEARRAVWELRPSLLEQGTLTTALTQMIEQLTVGVGIQASFLCRGAPQPLPLLLEESLFRIAQEALSNALLHARAQTVKSILTFGDQQVALEVNDDGQGFDKAKLTTQGFGLISGKNARIGRHLTISSQEGRGTLYAGSACTSTANGEAHIKPTEKTNPIRILIADDHPIVCEGLAMLLSRRPDMTVVAEAQNSREAVEFFRWLERRCPY
jgi:signal transduction histidine kinase